MRRVIFDPVETTNHLVLIPKGRRFKSAPSNHREQAGRPRKIPRVPASSPGDLGASRGDPESQATALTPRSAEDLGRPPRATDTFRMPAERPSQSQVHPRGFDSGNNLRSVQCNVRRAACCSTAKLQDQSWREATLTSGLRSGLPVLRDGSTLRTFQGRSKTPLVHSACPLTP
jgi:hypothetical protein